MISYYLLQRLLIASTILSIITARPCPHVEAYAKKVCAKKAIGVYNVDECHFCCLCAAAFRKATDCSFGIPYDTVCIPCIFDPEDSSNQTYMPEENNSTECLKSISESDCKHLQNTKYVSGSPTEPSRCDCMEGFHESSQIMRFGCNEHSPCEKGFQPVFVGSSSSDTECEACPLGSFSNISSPTSLCSPFSVCEPDQIIIHQGTSESDVVCSVAPSPITPNQLTVTISGNSDVHGVSPKRTAVPAYIIGVLLVVLGLAVMLLLCLLFCKRKSANLPRNREQNEDLIGLASLSIRTSVTSSRSETSLSSDEETQNIEERLSRDQPQNDSVSESVAKKFAKTMQSYIRRISESETDGDSLIIGAAMKNNGGDQLDIEHESLVPQFSLPLKPFAPSFPPTQEQDCDAHDESVVLENMDEDEQVGSQKVEGTLLGIDENEMENDLPPTKPEATTNDQMQNEQQMESLSQEECLCQSGSSTTQEQGECIATVSAENLRRCEQFARLEAAGRTSSLEAKHSGEL